MGGSFFGCDLGMLRGSGGKGEGWTQGARVEATE